MIRIYLLSILIYLPLFTLIADEHQQIFTHIYNTGAWGYNDKGEGFSGGGSLLENCRPYVDYLTHFMKLHDITSVVDAGCGDWEFSRFINWQNIDYIGYDVVQHVIEKNKKNYGSDHIAFVHANFLTTDLPVADLLICKQVLQHLTNEDILSFLPQLKKFKYCIITDAVYPETLSCDNEDAPIGGCHKVDLSQPPFNVKGVKALHYNKEGMHQVFLIDNTKDNIQGNN